MQAPRRPARRSGRSPTSRRRWPSSRPEAWSSKNTTYRGSRCRTASPPGAAPRPHGSRTARETSWPSVSACDDNANRHGLLDGDADLSERPQAPQRPADSFVGGGMWMPPRGALLKLREAIAEDPKRIGKIATDRRLVRRFGGMSEEAVLRRVPRGFAPDHPAARWLKFQSFVMGRGLTDAHAVSARLPALLESDFRLMLPLVRGINGVLGLPAAERR